MRFARRHLCLAGLLAGLILFLTLSASSAFAAGAGISGTVTNGLTRQGAPHVQVVLYDQNGSVVNATCTGTSPAGAYSLSVPQNGSYRVGFQSTDGFQKACGGSTNYLPEFYANKDTLATATVVTVSGDSVTTGVNQTLNPGGAITGTVTDATTKAALGSIEVDAYDTSNNQIVSETCTGSDGTYALFALPTGSYKVAFKNNDPDCGTEPAYISQYYNDKSSLSSANPISVTVTKTTADVNAALQPTSVRTLTVSFKGAGEGKVSFLPTGASCSKRCTHGYTPGSKVTIKAAAAKGSKFSGWSGGGCTGTKACTLTLSADRSVSAAFTSSKSSSGGGGGLGLTLPLPLGGSTNKSNCSLTVVSSKVLIKAPKKKALRRRLDRAILSYRCRRAARLTLTGSFTERLTRKHGKAHKKTFPAGTIHVRAKAGKKGTFYVKVPKAVLKALRAGTRVSASFTLRASDSHGTSRVTKRIKRLRTTRKA